jgi:NAD(P)H dehydrogenase (quinone)
MTMAHTAGALVAVFLTASCAGAAEPVRILIAYHSETGNTEQLALAVKDGVTAVKGASPVLRKASAVTDADIVNAAGILIGTPVHWHNLSAETKRLIDRIGEALGKSSKDWGEGRTAGAFTTVGGGSGGQEMARMSVISAMLAMRFVIVGGVTDEGFGSLGPYAVTGGKPGGVSARDRAEAKRFGERFARLTVQWKLQAGK